MPQGRRMTFQEILRDGDVLGALLFIAAMSTAIWFIATHEELVRRMFDYNPFR